MSWKKHFTRYDGDSAPRAKTNRWQSWLPEVYSGQPNRVERYVQYDQMDMDSEINAALDTIAEFSTQYDNDTKLPFEIHYKTEMTEAEVNAIETTLKQWCNINDWERRAFNMFRSTIKYGDQFFIRDPETWKLIWVNPADVTKVIVNESKGKEPDQYIIKNISLNLEDLTTTDTRKLQNINSAAGAGYTNQPNTGSGIHHGGAHNNNQEYVVDASHVIHIALTDGMSVNWPFGTSILESIFKVYKQKELLEDSIIIYRVQRAPERRVFYIDVGNMPAHKAMSFVERVKNEVHQTRIPNRTGGGTNVMDAAYNPLSIMEDYFFAQTAEGRGSKVEVLQGGDNLGEIDDLKYFNNKLMRGLRIPSSYLPTGGEDGVAPYNDGRVGTALIQEFRFSKYCERLQQVLLPSLDLEFKKFLKERGIEVPSNMYDLRFGEPQSFSQYRDIEIEAARANLFGQIEGVPYLSRRFILKKYLGLNEDELNENEYMWREENKDDVSVENDAKAELGGLGLRDGDIDNFEPTELGDEMGDDAAPDEAADEGNFDSPIAGNEGQEDEI
jgi:hypothetical protein